jgi:pyrroline-5-carboxylate reductase
MLQGDVPLSVGFLGAGQMATALASAWVKAGLLDLPRTRAADPYEQPRARFAAATGIETTSINGAVAMQCEVLVLAVKPYALHDVMAELKPLIEPRHTVVSIVAGVTLDTLAAGLGTERVVRVMPNTPCLVGASATGFATRFPQAPIEDRHIVGRLFQAVGVVFEMPETLLDAVTGLSGSGPAFVYLFIEALADGGVKCGLARDVAMALAAQTVLGAAKMVLETGQHPGALKDAVASPGGTTIAGLHALERGAFRAAAMDAVEAATRRAQELGKRE